VKEIIALTLVAWLTGCASFEVIDPQSGLTVKSSAYGRGCVAVDTRLDGTISVIVAQDGTSDWSVSRALAFIADLASSVFGGGDAADGMRGPGIENGCGQILEGSSGSDRSEMIEVAPDTTMGELIGE